MAKNKQQLIRRIEACLKKIDEHYFSYEGVSIQNWALKHIKCYRDIDL